MKNRDSIYLVVRDDQTWPHKSGHICGAYATAEAADNAAANYNQRWKDKGWEGLSIFDVRITTFYNDK